jgi:hypothetical protein
LRNDLLRDQKNDIAMSLSQIMHMARRFINMPGSTKDFEKFALDYYGEHAVIAATKGYQPAKILNELQEFIKDGSAGHYAEQIQKAHQALSNIINSLSDGTPFSDKFDTLLLKLARKVTRSAVVFPNTQMRNFAEWLIENNSAFDNNFRASLRKKVIITDEKEALDLLDMMKGSEYVYSRGNLSKRKNVGGSSFSSFLKGIKTCQPKQKKILKIFFMTRSRIFITPRKKS